MRLPTVGSGPLERTEQAGPVRGPEQRFEPPCPLVAVGPAVATAPALRFAEHLVAGLQRRHVAVGALVTGWGAPPRLDLERFEAESAPGRLAAAGARPVGRIRLSTDQDVERALGDALQRLCEARRGLIVTVGNEVPALYRTELTVVVTAGVVSPGWSPSARALRDRIDLELGDPRAGVAEALAERLA